MKEELKVQRKGDFASLSSYLKNLYFFNRHSYFFTVICRYYWLKWTCSKILKKLTMASCFFFFSFFPFSVLHFLPLPVYVTPFSTELYQKFYSQNAFITVLCPQTFCLPLQFPSSTLSLNTDYSFHSNLISDCPCPSLDAVTLATLFCSPFGKPCPGWWSFGNISNENIGWSICRTCPAWLQAQQVKQISKHSREMVKKSKPSPGRSGKSYFNNKLEYQYMLKNLE